MSSIMRTLVICLTVLLGVFLMPLADTYAVESPALPTLGSAVTVMQTSDDSAVRSFFPEWTWLQDSGIEVELVTDKLFLAAISVLGLVLTAVGLIRGK